MRRAVAVVVHSFLGNDGAAEEALADICGADELWAATTVWLEMHRRYAHLDPTDAVEVGVTGDPNRLLDIVAQGVADLVDAWNRGDTDGAEEVYAALDDADAVEVSCVVLALAVGAAGHAWTTHAAP